MKIAILSGSPRVSGVASRMAEAFAEGARSAGHEVTILPLASLSLRPCASCGRCIETGHCAVRDDIAKVEEALAGADLVVFASPTHYGNLSALLLNTCERLVGFFVDKRPFPPVARTMKGRRAAALVSCAAPWPFDFLLGHSSGCLSRIREICSQSGMRLGKTLVAPGTGRPGFSLEKYLGRARRMGAAL